MCSSMHSHVEDLLESSVNKNKIKIKILTGEFVFVLFFYAKIYPRDVPYHMKITRITIQH